MTDDEPKRPGAPAGNVNGQKHGGEAGVKSLVAGVPLHGLAAESQRQVEAELATDGRAAIVRRAAVRLEAVARLFFNAILAAADKGDIDKLAAYAQRYGWLQARALSAWAQLKQEKDDGNGPADYEKILEAKKYDDDSTH
jgi:hypothetical protein